MSGQDFFGDLSALWDDIREQTKPVVDAARDIKNTAADFQEDLKTVQNTLTDTGKETNNIQHSLTEPHQLDDKDL